jgi:REP element-mobilizing transposase RayT
MRKYPIAKNSFYHVYNRGAYKSKIFRCETDYRYFMYKIALYKTFYKIKLYIYCLMPNHYHFLLKCDQNPTRISKFMQAIQHSYTKYYNYKYDNYGHVFQGPYQNKPVPTKNSFRHIYDYIKENPVEAGLVKSPEDWPYLVEYGMV